MKYRSVFGRVQQLTGRSFTELHAGGGGIQNQALCQATACALGIPVTAGPVEATSCGNVLAQMLATGGIDTLSAGREMVRRSFEFTTYQPHDTQAWDAAYATYKQRIG